MFTHYTFHYLNLCTRTHTYKCRYGHTLNKHNCSHTDTQKHMQLHSLQINIFTLTFTQADCYPLKYIKPVIASHFERDSNNYVGRYRKTHIQTFEIRLSDMDIGTQSHTDDYTERNPYVQGHRYIYRYSATQPHSSAQLRMPNYMPAFQVMQGHKLEGWYHGAAGIAVSLGLSPSPVA